MDDLSRQRLSVAAGWWWADPLSGYVLVCYAGCEVRTIHRETRATSRVD